MPQFVSEAAERTRDDPTEGAVAELVVRVDGDRRSVARDWIADHDGVVNESLPSGLMQIAIPEHRLSALCDLEYVVSVEHANEHIGVFSQGNPNRSPERNTDAATISNRFRRS